MNVIKGADGVELIEVRIDNVDECLSFVSQESSSRVLLLSERCTSETLVDALIAHRDISCVERLSLMAPARNIKVFERCYWLTSINLGFEGSIFDFSLLSRLKKLGGVWSGDWTGLSNCDALCNVHVSKFHGGLKDLPSVRNLERVTLIQPTLTNLNGAEAAIRLEFLELSLAKGLIDISGLRGVGASLVELVIDGCKRISSYKDLGSLRQLRSLKITDSAEIESLMFLKDTTAIRSLNIAGSPLRDKDLSYCLTCESLREFRCEDRRGYSYKVRDVISAIRSRPLG